jgi:hypothetical protein
LPQSQGLSFSDYGKLVVILILKGHLRMPNQNEAAHCVTEGFLALRT